MEERLARYHHLPVPPPRLRSHDDDRPSSATPGLWVHIAARATGAMFAATNCWRTVDLSDAAARKWVDRGIFY